MTERAVERIMTDRWSMSRLLHGESWRGPLHELATSLREVFLQASSPFVHTGIHVAPMSPRWLRACEDECDKHGAEI